MNDNIVTRKRIELNHAVVSKRLRLRLSRTGGLSGAWHPFKGVTFNTQHGLRASKTRKGFTLGVQAGRLTFRGRWNLGKHFRLNLSRTKGFSLSWKNSLGSFNLTRPQYSSAKVFGIQLRGHKAHELQVFFTLIKLVLWSIQTASLTLLWIASSIVRIFRVLFFIAFVSGQMYQLTYEWLFQLGRLTGVIVSALSEAAWLEFRIAVIRFSSATPEVIDLIEPDSNAIEVGETREKIGSRPNISITQDTTVGEVIIAFKEAFRLNVCLYSGNESADSTLLLSEISETNWIEGGFKVSGRQRVATVEKNFRREFGCTLAVMGKNNLRARGNQTIASARIRD